MVNIIIDTLGSDKGEAELIKGAVEAALEEEINLTFVGKSELIEKELEGYSISKDRYKIIDAPGLIENSESPTLAIRRKKDSSLVRAMEALRDGEGGALVSAGSTGALLAGGLFIVKRIKGVDRAALASVFPTTSGTSFLLDMGANVDCKPEYLKQFAIMGSVYSEKILGINKPKVGLINIGEEEGKGDQLRLDSYKLLETTDINFIGNYEVRNIMTGKCDVMVCDGFTGNIILKTAEGLFGSLKEELKSSLDKSFKAKLGALLLKDQLMGLKENLDYREYGGAILLGVQKPIIKAHGSSDFYAFKNAIKQAKNVVDYDIVDTISDNIKI